MGVSGSGKSTALNLIFRTLDPTEGVVKIDG
jgi:ABC-type multidrug transport system fused ATPase/permease subunit